jgi:hypothetical protein
MGINPCPQNYPNLATTNIVREPGGLRDKITAARDWQLPPSPHRLVQAEEHSAKMGYVRQDDGNWQPPDD